jgi:hypothetical protein
MMLNSVMLAVMTILHKGITMNSLHGHELLSTFTGQSELLGFWTLYIVQNSIY